MEGYILRQVLVMQVLFVEGRCKHLFMEMEVAYGDFSSELVANPPPGALGKTWRQKNKFFIL